MTKIRRLLLLACVLIYCCFIMTACEKSSATNTSSGNGSVNIVVDENYINDIKSRGYIVVGCKADVPDFGYYDEDSGTYSGMEIELAYKTAAKIFGVTVDEAKSGEMVKFVPVTVDDREDKLESGEVDILFATYTITDERRQRFALSDSYYTDYIGMMVLKTATDSNSLGYSGIKSVADIDGKYIGVPRKATTRDEFMKYISTMNTISVNPIFCELQSYEQLFAALKKGNIDVMAVDVSILNGYVDEETEILPERFGGQNYGAAVKKENTAIMPYINDAINEK